MGKKQKKSNTGSKSNSAGGSSNTATTTNRNISTSSNSNLPPQSQSPPTQQQQQSQKKSLLESLQQWYQTEQQGIVWVFGCITLGCLFGFGIGSGWLTGASNQPIPAPWRVELAVRIRASIWYQILFWWSSNSNSSSTSTKETNEPLTPSHPRVFAVLREAIVREPNGYVHPDLGPLVPAPCGASRGIGMVRDNYHQCQTKCFPGVAKEKADLKRNQNAKLERNPENRTLWLPPIPDRQVYKQEEVLVRVPLSFQMTRQVALDTLLAMIPTEVQRKIISPHELDDAALLTLLLAHERGVGRHSRWLPYIASLPQQPSCGYAPQLQPYLSQSLRALQEELGVDTYGWKAELFKAQKHAQRIAQNLARDYGPHIQTPEGTTAMANIEWALCQVTSRATAGSEQHGALRLVPLMDMINHDANAGAFVELTGKERLEHGDFVEAVEDDAGAFVIRSLRHGHPKALRKGQELLVNYNVPHYSPLDWFVSLGFVPLERQQQWQKIDAALPRVRQDSYGMAGLDNQKPTLELWEEDYEPQILVQWRDHQRKKKQRRMTAASSSSGGSEANNGSSTSSGTTESTTSTTASSGNQESKIESQ